MGLTKPPNDWCPDVGPTDAGSWLMQYGNAYGLCQIYANEIWHFERVIAPGELSRARRRRDAEVNA